LQFEQPGEYRGFRSVERLSMSALFLPSTFVARSHCCSSKV
jgi:hypothetical protein